MRGVAATATLTRWDQTWWPIDMRFEADWVEPRSFGTCYVRLPALTGELSKDGADSSSAAIDRRLGRLEAHFAVTSYASTIIVGDAHVLPVDSAPPPKLLPTPTWSCQESDLSVQENGSDISPALARDRSGSTASSLDAFRRQAVYEGGCNAIAVVEQPGSRGVRDLLILVVGAGIALGMSLLVELFLRREPRGVAANR